MPFYRTLLRVRVEGRDRVPAQGGVIIAPNHISFFDSVALIQSMPRRTFFLGKAEYMKSAFTAKLFPAMGMIPLERDQTRQAMAALAVAAGVLDRGHPLAIYPEGTRSRDGLLHKGHTGVAQLAMMSGAPIVPVGLVGTDDIQPIGASVPRPFRKAVVRFGQPLDPTRYGGSARRRRQLLTEDLMEAIRRLSGQAVSDDFASDEPPLVRGGTETVYQVHTDRRSGRQLGPGRPLRRPLRLCGVRRRARRRDPSVALRDRGRRRRPLRHRSGGVHHVPAGAGGDAPTQERRMTESTYHVIELIGSSSDSWELAAQNAVREAAKRYQDLRVAEVVEMDVLIENGAVIAYRTKLRLSYKGPT